MRCVLSRGISLIAFFLAVLPVAQAVEQLPMSIPGGTYVTEDQGKELFDKGVKFIDARVAAEYADEHIKGATNVIYKETFAKESKTAPSDTFDAAKLPANKDQPLVFYCNGSPCWKGYKAAAVAIKSGYKKVYWLRDGIPAWKAKGYPTE